MRREPDSRLVVRSLDLFGPSPRTVSGISRLVASGWRHRVPARPARRLFVVRTQCETLYPLYIIEQILGELLELSREGHRNRRDLWYATVSAGYGALKKAIYEVLRVMMAVTVTGLVMNLSLAVRNGIRQGRCCRARSAC